MAIDHPVSRRLNSIIVTDSFIEGGHHQAEKMDVEQLVYPKVCRRKVMELAHEIPLAGHMGKEKMRHRILQRFYWPTLYKDLEEYCKCCLQCHKSNNKGVQCVPLIPLPIVGEPFKRIAMDIIGPLPKSRCGNRFILVICDYANCYMEAIHTEAY